MVKKQNIVVRRKILSNTSKRVSATRISGPRIWKLGLQLTSSIWDCAVGRGSNSIRQPHGAAPPWLLLITHPSRLCFIIIILLFVIACFLKFANSFSNIVTIWTVYPSSSVLSVPCVFTKEFYWTLTKLWSELSTCGLDFNWWGLCGAQNWCRSWNSTKNWGSLTCLFTKRLCWTHIYSPPLSFSVDWHM